MVGYRKDNFIYIMIPKNACTTYSELLERHGWVRFEIDVTADYSKYILWAHIQNPSVRHTKGLEQYLGITFGSKEYNEYAKTIVNILSDPIASKLIVSGVFDQHTYSLALMLGPLFHPQRLVWIPLDIQVWDESKMCYLDGDGLTNNFFKENNIAITVTKEDHKNVSNDNQKLVRNEIDKLKEKYSEQFGALWANILNPDRVLYEKVIGFYIQKFQTKNK